MNKKLFLSDFKYLLNKNLKPYIICGAYAVMLFVFLFIGINIPINSVAVPFMFGSLSFVTVISICILPVFTYFFGIKYFYKPIFIQRKNDELLPKLLACVCTNIVTVLVQIMVICSIFLSIFFFADSILELKEMFDFVMLSVNFSTIIIIIATYIIGIISAWTLIFLSSAVANMANNMIIVGVLFYFAMNSCAVAPIMNMIISTNLWFAFMNLISVGNISAAVNLIYIPYIGLEILFSIVFYFSTKTILNSKK